MSEEIKVKIPKGMVDSIQKRAWFKYYRDIEDFILNSMRNSIENWEKCALAYETEGEPDPKVEAIEGSRSVSTASVNTEKNEVSEDAKPPGCSHYVGYLTKEHPRRTPIPNECITCIKIDECLLRGE